MTKAKAARASAKTIRQACDACHFKKIRCLRGPGGGDGPCQRCNRESVECVFSPALKTGRPRKAASGHRPDTESTSGQSSATVVSDPSSFPRVPDFNESSFMAGSLAFSLSGLNDNVGDVSAENPPVFVDPYAVTNPGNIETSQVQVLTKLELLSTFQQQLVAKRREHSAVFSRRWDLDASQAIHELLQITQRVTDWSTWLMTQGAQFAWRRPMLDAMTDETALMMVVSPATLVLEIFAEILGMAFPSLKDGPSKPETSVSDGRGGLWAINPALLSGSTSNGSYPAETTVLPDVRAVQDLANPVCVYILLTALQEQLDAMRKAVDLCLVAFPRMNSALGAQGLLPSIVDDYLEKIRFVQGYITRASGVNLMTGLD